MFLKRKQTTITIASKLVETIERIMSSYQFLLVVDRLDESLVVWSFLTRVPLTDLMTMSSKTQQSWYLSHKRCIFLVGASVTPGIAAFFESDEWKLTHAGDRLLYQVANISLDRTIDEWIGRQSFEKKLFKFRSARQHVETMCRNQTHFPCSTNGTPQLELSQKNCYLRDFGCGYPCMDQYADQFL